MAATYPLPFAAVSASLYSRQPTKGCKYTGQAVRALPIRIISVGKKRSPGIQLIIEDYMSKLKPYCKVDDLPLRSNPNNSRDARVQCHDESAAMISLIAPDDLVVVLDEGGIDINSMQMADLIGDAANNGRSRLCFCVGGPYGHGHQMRTRSDQTIRLSSMVLNHEVALVVLVEQLYRAWTILKGQNYHH